MDYCSSCRRVLNGALVCPGCGDYAPDIAPPARYSAVPTTAPARGERHAEQAPAFRPPHGTPHRGAAPFGGDGVSEDVTAHRSDSGSSGGSAVAASTGQGRAARRRQRERWKKNRRRAAAATAFALVSGGLTATLLQSRASTGHTHAAAAPQLEGLATPRTLISAASSEEPDTEASRKPRTHRPATAGRQQKTRPASPATPPAATTVRQPKTAAAAHPLATSSATPDTAPTQANQAPADHADVAAPQATAPASTAGSDAATTPVPAAPSTPTAEPTSPAHLCLLGIVCVG